MRKSKIFLSLLLFGSGCFFAGYAFFVQYEIWRFFWIFDAAGYYAVNEPENYAAIVVGVGLMLWSFHLLRGFSKKWWLLVATLAVVLVGLVWFLAIPEKRSLSVTTVVDEGVSWCGIGTVMDGDILVARFIICEDNIKEAYKRGTYYVVETDTGRLWRKNIETNEVQTEGVERGIGDFREIPLEK